MAEIFDLFISHIIFWIIKTKTYCFDARGLTKNIFKNLPRYSIGVRKIFQLIFVRMLYNKKLTDLIQAEKNACSRKQRYLNRTLCFILMDGQFKLALQKNGGSYSYKTLATCAVNIYYLINANENIYIILIFHVLFIVSTASRFCFMLSLSAIEVTATAASANSYSKA